MNEKVKKNQKIPAVDVIGGWFKTVVLNLSTHSYPRSFR